MASEIPVVRHFQACLELVVEPGGVDVTLVKLIHAIVRLPGEPFPCLRDQMCLYVLLTNGRGEHEFALELVLFDQGEERLLHRSNPRRIELGQDPTMVHGLPIPRLKVIFPQAGQYSFYLLCDGDRIAEEHLEVR